ncbi:MAG TPA: cyclophilin-like fold protein [Phycisphaerae bacterium]|nr:cyclophilin-like fold protein [Phycisphaerae bacterium]
MTRIRINIGEVTVVAALNESNTARLVHEALPFDGSAQRWGDEVYFEIPVKTGQEDPQPEVPGGTVAYWPPGSALCLFFGQKPYSPVNVIGTIEGDPNVLAAVADGQPARVEEA